LPLNETTIPEALKSKNYYSAIIGKWHLGVGEKFEYLPTKHGFDSYFVCNRNAIDKAPYLMGRDRALTNAQ